MSTRKKTTRNMKPLRSFLHKAKNHNKKQKGGFLSLIIAALVAAGVSAGTAASAAAVIAPIAVGAAGAVGAYAANKIISAVDPGHKKGGNKSRGGSVMRSLQRRPLVMRNTRRR
jgi:alkylhydroperoxidase/carboxymuconolactone decarboxylase family protein YurZ